jgi:magnesium chelatase family protein
VGNRIARLAFIKTATIMGVDAIPVTAEVDVSFGLPGIDIVGIPDTAVAESRKRIRLALRATGFEMPDMRVVVNLAPSSMRKCGSGFDLPIALGILVATGQIDARLIEGSLCVGELSLNGDVKPVTGLLAYERLAHEQGLDLLTAPVTRGVYPPERQLHLCIGNLNDLRQPCFIEPAPHEPHSRRVQQDYAEIAGNDVAKRAMQIAAAGSHGTLLIGPPGSGKSMLASRLHTILPPLEEEERIESAMIYSVAGLPYDDILMGAKPFRSPHHSATYAGLMGGGVPPIPGEVSLAHNGILFLDEMPEFGSSVLQMLRQPMETGKVSLARATWTTLFPARFMLVAAANPCPCGFFGDPERSCRCTEPQINRYQGRIGGPLIDRIDLVVDVWRSKPEHVLATGTGSSSKTLREGVLAAHEFRRWREQKAEKGGARPEVTFDGEGVRLLASCGLRQGERAFLESLAQHHRLSGRAIMRALAVARTIADIEQQPKVGKEHLVEAVNYRSKGGDDQ